MSEALRRWSEPFLRPLSNFYIRLGIFPNHLTIAGCGISLLAAWTLGSGHPRGALPLFVLSALADATDGLLARETGRESRFGAFLDSSLDRVSEIALALGGAAYFNGLGRLTMSMTAWIMWALGASLMVSYLRARAEGLGLRADVGWLQRPQRGALVALGLLAAPWGLEWAVVLIALFGSATVAQRMVYVARNAGTSGRDGA